MHSDFRDVLFSGEVGQCELFRGVGVGGLTDSYMLSQSGGMENKTCRASQSVKTAHQMKAYANVMEQRKSVNRGLDLI